VTKEELFSALATPFTGEALFDCLPDVVFFVKNARGEYVVVNRTLVERCGCGGKSDLLGRRVDEVFPSPLGDNYRMQDEAVLREGRTVLDQLELHFYPSRRRGWCLTTKMPLTDHRGRVIGLMGISRDLPALTDGDGLSSVAEAVRHIQRNFGEPLRVAELARRAGLSSYQFDRRVRRAFQLSPGQLIQKTRLEAALQRLRETDAAIASIAIECGYSDQSAFTRKFRQVVGLSPSAYRARHNRIGL
jgi:AraC-like DNA-binding protein